MLDFEKQFPQLANWLRLRQTTINTVPTDSRSHWVLLGLFGLLSVATFPQQLLLLLVLTGLTAMVKGPGMLLYGALYSFLVSLVPLLGLLLSVLFFILSIHQLTKNWRFGLAASFFYLYPFGITAIKQFTAWDNTWSLPALIGAGIIGCHFLLTWLHRHQVAGPVLLWGIITVPYDCLLFLIPTKSKNGPVRRHFTRKNL